MYFLSMKKIKLACIIEDNPANIFWMEEIIEEVGFCEELLIFYNGKEALDGLNEIISKDDKLPGVIFLDLNMPVMDGWEFLDEFTKKPPASTPIIIYIVTSSINPADLIKARNYELVTNYIVKPVTVERLKEILHEI